MEQPVNSLLRGWAAPHFQVEFNSRQLDRLMRIASIDRLVPEKTLVKLALTWIFAGLSAFLLEPIWRLNVSAAESQAPWLKTLSRNGYRS